MPALASLLVALLVGFLIGLDRERSEARKERALFAGVRTFPLIALTGAFSVLLLDVGGRALVLGSFAAVAAISIVSYVSGVRRGDVGATTEIAALVTFLLGALAGAGELTLAGAGGVIVAVLLAAKPPLEAFSRALGREELVAVLELAVISVIVLPALPDRGYGPWEVLNPRRIWLVVVLISSLSFAGFVAIRLLGPGRGTVVTGAVGGLVSSTAVTLAMAERSRAAGGVGAPAAAAVVASTVMCARMVVIAGAIDARLVPRVGAGMALMGVVGCVAVWILVRGQAALDASSTVRNPFSLTAALGFAAIYSIVLLVTHAGVQWLGEAGLYATAALSGTVDVDAPTVASARLALQGPWQPSAVAILIAAVSNTIVKLGLAVGLGAGTFRRQVAIALGAMALAGGLAVGVLATMS